MGSLDGSRVIIPGLMKRSSRFVRLVVGVIGAVLVVAVLIALLWVHDVWEDRQHSVSVKSDTPLYAGSADESCGGTRIGVIRPGTAVRVQRIRYWKNCATIDVALPDGRKGYIVLGDGDVSVSPALR